MFMKQKPNLNRINRIYRIYRINQKNAIKEKDVTRNKKFYYKKSHKK